MVPYKPLLDDAIDQARLKPEHCIVLQRAMLKADLIAPRDLDWHDVLADAEPVDCVEVESNHPLYILYTSGTTGQPKGIVRDTGGYIVALKWSMSNIYNVKPGDV
jgi:propionyl-CoA synthetase